MLHATAQANLRNADANAPATHFSSSLSKFQPADGMALPIIRH
jgi:hypothetical protein